MISQSSLTEMVTQSRDVISNPSVPTFERYEHRGTMANAGVYIGIAAVVSAVLGLIGALLPGPPNASIGGVIGSLLTALTQFFVFTGMVYFLGKNMYGGSGTWDEVAYTFSLFIAPLIVLGAVIGLVVNLFAWVPLINILVGFVAAIVGILLLLVQIFYGYLAVQSSMNLRNQTQAVIVLVLSFVGSAVIMGMISLVFRF
ncbi:MAG: YIP1 family protein [Oscillochloridaceae bacterium umkhey_bin13]